MYLEIKNVEYAYPNQRKKKILDNISYKFETGLVYAIQGVSGSGKTTLLSLLGGLDEPQKGEIKVNDKKIQEIGYRNHRRNNVSIIFQNYNLIDYLTPMENIRLLNAKANPDYLLQLGIEPEDIYRNVLHLSGGQQQRVAIARALVSDVPFILADEPTGNLDEAQAQEIMDILKTISVKENKCVILVTHSQKIAKQADVILRLNNRGLKQTKKTPSI